MMAWLASIGFAHQTSGQWNLYCLHAEGDLQCVLGRPGSKLDENFGAAVRSRLNPYDMGVIGCAHERTDGVGKCGGQRCRQEGGKRALRWLRGGPCPWDGLIWHTQSPALLGRHAMVG